MRNIVFALLLLLATVRPAGAHRAHRWRLLSVTWVTGYDNTGRTSTGSWARSGECAVDPRYIPFGSIIRIPGVGVCRAEDTGGAVVGWHVDVWEPTAAACYRITGWYRGVSVWSN